MAEEHKVREESQSRGSETRSRRRYNLADIGMGKVRAAHAAREAQKPYYTLNPFIGPHVGTAVEGVNEPPRHLSRLDASLGKFVSYGEIMEILDSSVTHPGEDHLASDFRMIHILTSGDSVTQIDLPIGKVKEIKSREVSGEVMHKQTFPGWRRVILDLPYHLCRDVEQAAVLKNVDADVVVRNILRMHFAEERSARAEDGEAVVEAYNTEYARLPADDFPSVQVSRRAITGD